MHGDIEMNKLPLTMSLGVASICVSDNKYYQMQMPNLVQHMIAMTYFAIPLFVHV
jgi:hypothetical protein